MFPFFDSSSSTPFPMDLPLYHHLHLTPPPSPNQPHQSTSSSFFYYPSSPPPFAADASSFHLTYHLASPTPPPQPVIADDSPELHPPQMMDHPPPPPPPTDAANPEAAGATGVSAGSRKDRHSKICTAGGMRDRRMRLSLDVARKFFALQDMLGFDKASKTVQWLLNTSKSAIQEIMATDDASSECVEDGSSISLLSVDGKHHNNPAAELGGGGDQQQHPKGHKPAKPRKSATTTPKPARKSAGNAAHPVPDKETRAKARERARERTKEKHRMRWVKLASAIDVEAAAATVARDRLAGLNNNLNHQSSSNMANIAAAAAAAELEERCSSTTLNNGGRMQEITGAGDVILAFGNGGYGAGAGNYYCQEQWDLGGVVFQQNNSRFY